MAEYTSRDVVRSVTERLVGQIVTVPQIVMATLEVLKDRGFLALETPVADTTAGATARDEQGGA